MPKTRQESLLHRVVDSAIAKLFAFKQVHLYSLKMVPSIIVTLSYFENFRHTVYSLDIFCTSGLES